MTGAKEWKGKVYHYLPLPGTASCWGLLLSSLLEPAPAAAATPSPEWPGTESPVLPAPKGRTDHISDLPYPTSPLLQAGTENTGSGRMRRP